MFKYIKRHGSDKIKAENHRRDFLQTLVTEAEEVAKCEKTLKVRKMTDEEKVKYGII